MKSIRCLSEKIQHFCKWSDLAGLLVFMFVFVPFPVLACQNGPLPVPTQAERLAAADLVFSGKIIAADNTNGPYLDLRIEVVNMVKGRADRVVQVRALSQIPCGEGFYFLKAGQWWTFYLYQDKAEGVLFIGDVEPFCEKNARPTPGGSRGTCSKVLTQAVELNRIRIDAGSMVSVGPERSTAAIQFARLQGRSSFAGVALPPGTAWFAALEEFDLPSRLTIGPVRMIGRVGLMYLPDSTKSRLTIGPVSMGGRLLLMYRPDSTKMRGTFYASLSHDHRGQLTLHGAQVHMVRLTAPGWAVQEARLSTAGIMRGIYIEDYVTFTPDGKFATFRSARDQVVNGVQLKKCDSVDLVDGRVVAGKFFNACAGR